MAEQRYAQVHRKTNETDISLTLTLDGNGKQDIATGIGFFDHMLSGFTRHGFFDLDLKVAGDLEVDCHHTIEDTGIVLGNAIREALGDKKGIKRFGSMILPMDETLVLCAIDLSGRPYFAFDAEFTTDRVGAADADGRAVDRAVEIVRRLGSRGKMLHGKAAAGQGADGRFNVHGTCLHKIE